MGKLIPQRLQSEVTTSPAAALAMKPELLAPAGDWECVKAAVENGADAVYFGLSRFNARLRAHNFTEADLPELMSFLHERGVKGYVTFNTLVFTDELEDAADFLRAIITAGVDAAIVQDVGICRLIREISPDFPIHASTQMSVTSEAGVRFARDLGASVVVLARECSLREVAAIREKTVAAEVEVPLEIFVHGALCVAYSGQCLTSEALGGRSANRGECAQACRLPYDLVSDGETVDLKDRRYLLSPQDLAGVDNMVELIEAGVATLKIEGRLKAPEYVAGVTQVYRKAIDRAWQSREDFSVVTEEERYQLEMTFSRGLSSGWLEGIDNQKLVHARFGKKRGVRLGTVTRILPEKGVLIRATSSAKAGDGVVFDAGRPDQKEEGGNLVGFETQGELTLLRFFGKSVDLDQVSPGDIVWKTADPALERKLQQSWQGEQPQQKSPIWAEVTGAVGEPLGLLLRDGLGRSIAVESEQVLQAAEKKPLTDAFLLKQLGRMGTSPFSLAGVKNELVGDCMLPVSALNQLRRDAVEQLITRRREPLRWEINEQSRAALEIVAEPEQSPKAELGQPYLIPYVRSSAQLETVLGLGYPEIYLELEDPRGYEQAVQLVKQNAAAGAEPELWVAPPRIYKTGEDWIIKQLRESGATGFLARNHEHLRAFADQRLRGDFSLNVANPLTADYFLQKFELERLTASYDLNQDQLTSLLRGTRSGAFEITLHQHIPMFHMEHCVFCAFMSEGKDFRDCGRPCEKHTVKLRDRVGAEHPLKADGGCRNTLFNARAQTGAEYYEQFAKSGVAALRIEFLNESPAAVRQTLASYESLLKGTLSGQQLWRELKLVNQLGVTRGTLRNA